MYEFVTGPLVWLSFAIFFIGLILSSSQYSVRIRRPILGQCSWMISKVSKTRWGRKSFWAKSSSRREQQDSISVFCWANDSVSIPVRSHCQNQQCCWRTNCCRTGSGRQFDRPNQHSIRSRWSPKRRFRCVCMFGYVALTLFFSVWSICRNCRRRSATSDARSSRQY